MEYVSTNTGLWLIFDKVCNNYSHWAKCKATFLIIPTVVSTWVVSKWQIAIVCQKSWHIVKHWGLQADIIKRRRNLLLAFFRAFPSLIYKNVRGNMWNCFERKSWALRQTLVWWEKTFSIGHKIPSNTAREKSVFRNVFCASSLDKFSESQIILFENFVF